jgi:hypothetical protein
MNHSPEINQRHHRFRGSDGVAVGSGVTVGDATEVPHSRKSMSTAVTSSPMLTVPS